MKESEVGGDSFNCTGRPDYVLAFKLRALKGKLKEWRFSTKVHWGHKRKLSYKLFFNSQLQLQPDSVRWEWNLFIKQLEEFDRIQEKRLLSQVEATERVSLQMESENIAKHEEVAWRQRSKALCLKEGDRNTIFFHRNSRSHRKMNTIYKLVVEEGSTKRD